MDNSHEHREQVAQAHLPTRRHRRRRFRRPLRRARGLARALVTVTIVDKHNYHLFRPMLYQVATGPLPDEIAAPIRSILRRQKNVPVPYGGGGRVDPHARAVFTREGTVAYDYLVLATGIEYNYFGHEGGNPTPRDLLRWTTPTGFEARSLQRLNQPSGAKRNHRYHSPQDRAPAGALDLACPR